MNQRVNCQDSDTYPATMLFERFSLSNVKCSWRSAGSLASLRDQRPQKRFSHFSFVDTHHPLLRLSHPPRLILSFRAIPVSPFQNFHDNSNNNIMKLRKGRGASRTLAAEPLFVEGPNNDVRRHKTSPFCLFDTFRKVARGGGGGGGAALVEQATTPAAPVVDEDETRLLKKGSYAYSEKTEPTAAMTAISESMSSVSSEIIGKAFAIFQTPSENTEIHFTHNFEDMLEFEKTSSPGGGASNNTKLSRTSLDILEAVQLQKEFSNMQFRTQSMKVVEYNAEPPLETIEDDMQLEPVEPDGLQLRTDSLKVVEYHSEPPSFDENFLDRYLIESRHDQPSAPTADVWRSVDPPGGRDDLGSMMSGHRIVTANEYISASSSSEEEGDEVDDDSGTEADKEERSTLLPPLHSPGSSSTSESVWEKGSSGNQSRERSLLDVINTEPEERMVDEEQDAGHTDSDDCSTVDFGDGIHSVEDGGGTIEGPDSPLSFGSSVELDEYEELDALAALTGLLVNIVNCNLNDLAAIGDEEDDYSVVEIDHAFPDVGVEVQTQLPAMKSVADRVPTPPAAKPTSFWGMVFSCV
jgi:hypothetical protein